MIVVFGTFFKLKTYIRGWQLYVRLSKDCTGSGTKEKSDIATIQMVATRRIE